MSIGALSFRSFDAQLMTQYSDLASKRLGRDFWVVVKPFTYYLGYKGSNRTVTVPAGYLTDGASTPQLFWSLIPPWGRYGQATALHDRLCETLTIMVDGVPTSISRKEADQVFNEAMKVLQVPRLQRWLIYGAVTLHRVVNRINKPRFLEGKQHVQDEVDKCFHDWGYYP